MIEVVLDASVVLKWFRGRGERHLSDARSLRRDFEAGEIVVLAPGLLHLEILNVAGRRWGMGETAMADLAASLEELGFEIEEPHLGPVASWTARGLTAYDATYVALAEAELVPLVTDEERILDVAPDVARPLAGWTA